MLSEPQMEIDLLLEEYWAFHLDFSFSVEIKMKQ